MFYDANKEYVGCKIGTGFFVDNPEDFRMTTALHVITSKDESLNAKYSLIVISYGYEPGENIADNDPKNFTVIYPSKNKDKYWQVDESNDLIVFDLKGILTVEPNNAMDYIKRTKDLPGLGDFAATMGHTVDRPYFNYCEGTVTSTAKNKTQIITNFSDVSHGNSGGAVINSDNIVFGVISAGIENGVLVQFASATTSLKSLIDKLKANDKGDTKELNEYISDVKFDDEFITTPPKFKLKYKD